MKFADEIYLLEKLKEGDVHALELLFHRHYDNLRNYLKLVFKDQIMADHIAQDIFVYLWENRKSLVVRGTVESYLYTAGRYKAINQIRNDRRHQTIEKELELRSPEYENITDRQLEAAELSDIIEEAISTLPERCQQIFRLSRIEELSNREIAVFLGLSENTIEGQMTIAFKKLRKILQPFYFRLLLSI